jgi:hypothetical protein
MRQMMIFEDQKTYPKIICAETQSRCTSSERYWPVALEDVTIFVAIIRIINTPFHGGTAFYKVSIGHGLASDDPNRLVRLVMTM